MKLQGSLVERDFPELIHDLSESHWTGLLTLTHMGVGRSVSVQQGRMVFAASTSADDRLGELLIRQGRISLRQYADAGPAVAPGKRLGAILVEQGVLTPKDLVRAVVEQTQEIIYGAFQWTEGQYRLQEGAVAAEAITLKISTPHIIMEGIRRIESWHRIQRAVGGLDASYERAANYEDTLRLLNPSLEKLTLLTGLNQPMTLEALCTESTLSDFEVCRTMWAYKVIGVVRRLDAPSPRRAAVEDEGLGLVLPE
jgi:Domain of unknown function (DUF4388)